MRNFVIKTILVGCITIIVLCFILENKDRTIINIVSIIGTCFSLTGLIIAIKQISALNKITDATKKAVDSNTLRINQVLSISEVSRAVKLVEQIQEFIRNSMYEKAHLRMQDLKYIIIKTEAMDELKKIISEKPVRKYLLTLSSDINSVSEYIVNKDLKINFKVLNSNMEALSTYLIEFETKLKSVNYVN